MSEPLVCPHDHGSLHRFVPATWDGASIVIGGCQTCGGLWIPVWAIRSVLPEELSLAMAQVSVSEKAPRCHNCAKRPRMGQQHFGGIEVDRCLYCHSLWLEGGELGSLQTTADDAMAHPACDACGVCVTAGQLSPTGMGRLCRTCLDAATLTQQSAPPIPTPTVGGPTGSQSIDWSVDPRGGETLFEFHGGLSGCAVRGSITHENRFSRMLKAVGTTDTEVGHPRFDARFLVKAGDEDAMRRWLGSGRVAEDLLLLDAEGGCTVRVDGEDIEIRGSQAAARPAPNVVVEQAATRIYQALLALGG